MKWQKTSVFIASLCLLCSTSILAQSVFYGDPNVSGNPAQNPSYWREGLPITLQITTQNAPYGFGGQPLDIPFTLEGSRATVRLAVYTKGANPQYPGGLGRGGPGNALLRASGIDTFIAVTEGRLFSEGDNVFSWDGLDYHGKPIPPGTYDFFLIGLNDVDKPTYISNSGNVWTQVGWDTSVDPPHIWWTPGNANGREAVNKSIWGSNYISNPRTWEKFAVPWMNERRGIEGTFWDIASYNIDPQDPTLHYALNYRNQDDSVDRGTGIWRIKYDEAVGTLLPDENWGGDSDRGWLQWEGRLPSAAMTSDPHHPWLGDDGFLYVAWRDHLFKPYTPGILKIDRAAGEVVEIIDFSDIYVGPSEQPDGSFKINGPFGIDLDEERFYATGMWQDPGSYPSSTSLDGEIMWINQNGDGFTDRYTDDEAEARGLTQPTGLLSIHGSVGKWKLFMASGTSVPHKAELYGPDGAGLLKVFVPYSYFQHSGETWWHATEDKTAGLYWSSGQAHLMHSPFDVERGSIMPGDFPELSMPDLSGKSGELVVFPVQLDGAAAVAGADLTVDYDPAILSFRGLKRGSLTQGSDFLVATNDSSPGKIIVSIAGSQAFGGDSGTLIELEFQAATYDPEGANFTELRFSRTLLANAEGESTPALRTKGSFTLTSLLPGLAGDVNQDDEITAADAVLVLRQIVGLGTLDGLQQLLADVNDDGQISSGDAVLILRKAAQLIPKVATDEEPVLEIIWGGPKRTSRGEVVIPLVLEGGIYGGDFIARYQGAIWKPKKLNVDGQNAVWLMHTPSPGELRFSIASAEPLAHLELVLEGGEGTPRAGLVSLEQALTFDQLGQVATAQITAVEEREADLPQRYALLQNYPNPFNPETRITYLLPRSEEVVLQVYTLTGQRLRTLADGAASGGLHTATWDGRDEAGRAVGSGVYLIRMQAGEFVATKRMTLLQ